MGAGQEAARLVHVDAADPDHAADPDYTPFNPMGSIPFPHATHGGGGGGGGVGGGGGGGGGGSSGGDYTIPPPVRSCYDTVDFEGAARLNGVSTAPTYDTRYAPIAAPTYDTRPTNTVQGPAVLYDVMVESAAPRPVQMIRGSASQVPSTRDHGATEVYGDHGATEVYGDHGATDVYGKVQPCAA